MDDTLCLTSALHGAPETHHTKPSIYSASHAYMRTYKLCCIHVLFASLLWCLPAAGRAMLHRRHQQEMQDLQDIAYAMELRFSEQESDALMEFQGLVDEIKNKVGWGEEGGGEGQQ